MVFKWRDNSIRIISVLIAVLLWVYVTNEQNPVTDQTFIIPLVARDSPEEYDVEGLPGTVSVRVRGAKNVIDTLQREDFSARVNLAGIKKAGRQDLAVQIAAPPEVEVLYTSPSLVQVRAEKIVQKNVPVSLSLRGTVAAGVQAGQPALRPAVVTVRGPASLLEEIRRLNVSLDVSGIDETIVRELPLQTGVEGVTANPDRVTVTVPVTALSIRSLPVRLRLTGEPAPGYQVGDTAVSPQTVQVTAKDEVIRGLTAVSTMALDISGLTGDEEREVILILPDGARAVEPDRITATVRITPVEEEQPAPPTPPTPVPPPEEENNTQ
ncbi:MAG: CdaR family protein [Firmicutes bacterium]|nr:CdaR family protein [Bacillota bacterium]